MIDIDNLETKISTKPVLDIISQPISVNDIVCYTTETKGSNLRKGIVLDITYDNTGEGLLTIDNCKCKLYGPDVVVINELLKLQGIEPENLTKKYVATKKENKKIYFFYAVDVQKEVDGFIFFKPKYTGNKEFEIEFKELQNQYPELIIFPFARNQIAFDWAIKSAINEKKIQLPEEVNKFTGVNYSILLPINIRPTFQNAFHYTFNFKLSNIIQITDIGFNKTFQNNNVNLNEFIQFSVDKSGINDYYLDINNISYSDRFLNNDSKIINVNDIIKIFKYFWNIYLPTLKTIFTKNTYHYVYDAYEPLINIFSCKKLPDKYNI